MRPEKLILDQKATTRFSHSITQKCRNIGNEHVARDSEESIGGVIRNGQLSWIAYGRHIEVFSTKNGNKVASYTFDDLHRSSNTLITCVSEVNIVGINSTILMIGVQCNPIIGGSLYLFSVQGCRILHRIDVIDRITSCCLVNTATCQRSCLTKFDGCVAIGTDQGKVFLMDLNLRKCKEVILGKHVYDAKLDVSTCQIVLANLNPIEIINSHREAQKDNLNFGIQLEVLAKAGPILSILSLTPLISLSIGVEDGQMLLYDLEDLQAYHLAYPPERDSPLVKLTYIEPTDDPRPCVYIWAFHTNANISIAVMHSISFESKTIQDDNYIYENFQSCSPRLTIPICEKGSMPIACQSISKVVSDEDDEILSLCLLAWATKTESFMMVFDLNQWYKEQMPHVCDWTEYPSYLAPFPVPHTEVPLDIWLNSKSVATFNSIQRPEEHFYPTSLSFDCVKLTDNGTASFRWAGLQNKALEKLSSFGSIALLEPDECFTDILEACLIPQFSDQNYHSNPSTRMKQEFLLSMALQYNCMGILKECARLWADGSHLGNQPSESLSLSILTDWIWNQATVIKDCCNNLCVPLFDYSGCSVDLRSRKILAHCSRELKLLADLLHMIVTQCRQNIPDEIYDTLCCQRNSIRMTSEYQEVLQWLLNMGLLPEVAWGQFSRHNSQLSLAYTPNTSMEVFTPVPYPYRILNEYYTAQRQKFYEIDRSLLMPKTNSCRCLFIDMFIEKECDSPQLRAEWKNGTGDSLYPPPSLQAMLRILLIPGISLENKYMLFVYLFLDLNMALEDERYYRVVQNLIKFPAVFKLNPFLIKAAQAFWNLDHKEFDTALDELISPLTNDRYISQWQQDLLINTLLIQDMPHLALRALRAPGPPVNAILEIKTLLANSLITEAFELQRSKCDENLLLEFFKGCHEMKKWNHVLGLVLTEREGEALSKFLQSHSSLLTENLQLLYLLQRNKYIEAINYLDGLKYKPRPRGLKQKLENTQDLIFSSYKLAMAPSEKELTDIFVSIRDRIPKRDKEAVDDVSPFSTVLNKQLMGNELNVFHGIFHRAILNTKATSSAVIHPSNGVDANENYIPFLSKPQIDFDFFENSNQNPVSYANPYVPSCKRRKERVYDEKEVSEGNQPAAKRQRTDSFSIVDRPGKKASTSLLASFRSKHLEKSKGILDQTSSTTPNGSPIHKATADESINLLSTPVVKNMRLEKRMAGREDRAQTPQSILKNRHTDHGSVASRRSPSPTFTAGSARRSVDFDDRSLRFTTHNASMDSADDYRLTAIPESNVDDESGSDPMKVSYASIQARPGIHTTTNVSLMSTSTDEFFSPETSNFSDRPIIRTVEEMESETDEDQESDRVSKVSQGESLVAPKQRTPVKQQIHSRSRSATPEISARSSSRMMMTRSKSKQQLNETEDSFDSDQPNEVETSTPLQSSIKGRSSIRSFKALSQPLSKTVVESNAIKAFIERSKVSNSVLNVEEPKGQMQSDSVDTSDVSDLSTDTPIRERKNILSDKSHVSESALKRYRHELDSTVYSDSPSFDTTNIRFRRNVLHDSSDNETPRRAEVDKSSSFRENEAMSEDNVQVNENVIDFEEKSTQEVQEEVEEAAQSVNMGIDKTVSISGEVTATVPEEIFANEKADQTPSNVSGADETTSNVSETDEPDSEYMSSSENQATRYRRNILADDSKVSETFLRRYNEKINTTVCSDTSSVFTHRRNILEDSSPGPHIEDRNRITTTTPRRVEISTREENIRFEFDQVKPTNEEQLKQQTEKLANYFNEDIEEVEEEQEEEEEFYASKQSDSDIEEMVEDESTTSSSTGSSSSTSSSSNEKVGDVINISSGSEESNEPAMKASGTIDLTRTKSMENAGGDPRIPNYSIEDLFTEGMDDEAERQEHDEVSSNILNEMIYGDLQIDEPVDMANSEAIYFNMESSSVARDQRNDEVLDIPFSASENIYLVNTGPSTSAQPIPSPENLIVIDQQTRADVVNPTDIHVGSTQDTGIESTQDLHNVADIEMSDVTSATTAKVVEKNENERVGDVKSLGKEKTTDKILADETADVFNQGTVTDSIKVEEVDSVANTLKADHTADKTDALNEGMVDVDASKVYATSETLLKSEKIITTKPTEMIEDQNQPSTSKSALAKQKMTKSKIELVETPRLPAKRTRSNSVSTKSDGGSEKATRSTRADSVPSDNETIKRSTRAKSATADDDKSTLRSHKSASKLDTESKSKSTEASPNRPLTRHQSQTLETVSESPKSTTRSTRKRTASEASDAPSSQVKSSQGSEAAQTPKRNLRKRESDNESMASTPSRRSAEQDVLTTPSTRSRRKLTEQDASSVDSKLETSTRKRATRSSKKDDDTMSESSIASSTRSTRKIKKEPDDDDKASVKSEKSSIASSTRSTRKIKKEPDDDGKASVRSDKSTRSKKAVKAPSTPAALPVIKEDEQAGQIEYETSSRRLTRGQRATMERYLTDKRKFESAPPGRVMTRRQSANQSLTEGVEDDDDFSDAESVTSNVTRSSRASKASNTSKVSKASRTTKASDTSRASRSSKRLQAKKASQS